MAQDWRLEINRVLVLLLAGALLGFLFGNIPLFLFIALLIYLGFALIQLRKLDVWLRSLKQDMDAPPPEGTGLWGVLFDGIYRLHRGERRAHKVLERTLNRAQTSVAALDIGVILIDKKNRLEWWNSAAQNMLGIHFPADRGQNAINLMRDPSFTSYFNKEEYNEPLITNSPHNSNMILEFKITLFGKKEKLMIVRDITQIHRLEMMRKDFVGNVSHELRTPITVISGYLENLMDANQIVDPKWEKALEQMYQQSQRVENILRDLLMLSRLETRAISMDQTEINVRNLLSEVRNDTQNIFEEKHHNVTVQCDEELALIADRGELYSAISNLSINAAKYTPDGGNIVLSAERTRQGIEIAVADNGIGIAPQHIPRLTERFYRVDKSRSSSTGGTGLGLAIVKHILARHGASLHIESEAGKGSRFICRFPVKSENAATAA